MIYFLHKFYEIFLNKYFYINFMKKYDSLQSSYLCISILKYLIDYHLVF